MKHILKRIVISLAVLAGVAVPLYAAPAAHAALFDNAKQNACAGINVGSSVRCDNSAAGKLTRTINNAITVITIIVGIVSVIMMIIAGFKYITSNGDTNAVASAKHTLIYAIVGIIVVAFAQTVIKYILVRITR